MWNGFTGEFDQSDDELSFLLNNSSSEFSELLWIGVGCVVLWIQGVLAGVSIMGCGWKHWRRWDDWGGGCGLEGILCFLVHVCCWRPPEDVNPAKHPGWGQGRNGPPPLQRLVIWTLWGKVEPCIMNQIWVSMKKGDLVELECDLTMWDLAKICLLQLHPVTYCQPPFHISPFHLPFFYLPNEQLLSPHKVCHLAASFEQWCCSITTHWQWTPKPTHRQVQVP